jgi:hypothetical protein
MNIIHSSILSESYMFYVTYSASLDKRILLFTNLVFWISVRNTKVKLNLGRLLVNLFQASKLSNIPSQAKHAPERWCIIILAS